MGLTVLMLGLDIAKRLRLARWPATRRAGNDVLGAGVRHPPRRWPESVSEMWLLYTATYVWKLHLWGALWGAACPVVGAWRRASAQPPGPQAQPWAQRATLRSPHASQSPQLKC